MFYRYPLSVLLVLPWLRADLLGRVWIRNRNRFRRRREISSRARFQALTEGFAPRSLCCCWEIYTYRRRINLLFNDEG